MNLGIIGLGFMGATHLKAFSQLPGVRVAAISTNDPRARAGDLSHIGGNLGRETGSYDFSNLRAYENWRDLIADRDLDAVDVCLPTDLHAAVALAALAAGKHVLVEKPMALSAADCDHMIDAAEAAKRVLMVAQVLRFWPEYLYLKDFVASQRCGAVLAATFTRRCGLPDWSRWLPDEQRSGGALLDLLVHDIDQILLLFGAPARVAAKDLGPVDTLSATFLYPNGPEVRLQGGWFPPGIPFAMGFRVRAERAELELTPAGLRENGVSGASEIMHPEGGDAYQAEARYFVECCRSNTPPARCLPVDSARAVKLALLLKQSRDEGGNQIPCVL